MCIRWGCIEGSGGFPDPFAAALIDRRLKSRLAARRCFCRSRVLGQMPAPGSWVSFLPLSGNGLDPADVAGSGSHVGVVESRGNPARVVGVDPQSNLFVIFGEPKICWTPKTDSYRCGSTAWMCSIDFHLPDPVLPAGEKDVGMGFPARRRGAAPFGENRVKRTG